MDSLKRGLGETASDNATAFGFSLTTGGTALILSNLQGSPTVGEVFLFIGGAAAAMIVISALSTRGFRTETDEPLPERAQMRGSALNMLSVGCGLLGAWAVGALIESAPGWAAGGFVAILLYLTIESLEYAGTLKVEDE